MLKILSYSSCWDFEHPFFLGLQIRPPYFSWETDLRDDTWRCKHGFLNHGPSRRYFLLVIPLSWPVWFSIASWCSCSILRPFSVTQRLRRVARKSETSAAENQVLLVKSWIVDNAGGKGHPTELTVEKASLPRKAGRFHVFCLDCPLGSNTWYVNGLVSLPSLPGSHVWRDGPGTTCLQHLLSRHFLVEILWGKCQKSK